MIHWVVTPKRWRPPSPSAFLAWMGPRLVKTPLPKTTSSQEHEGKSKVMSWLMSSPSSLFSPLQSITRNIKQRVWYWIGLIQSSIVQHQIPRDKSRSKLRNQRQADSKWRAFRQRVLPYCCWKGRSPQTPGTTCGRRDKKTPPEIEENQSQQGAWTRNDKTVITMNSS